METVLYHNQRNEVGAKMDGLEGRGEECLIMCPTVIRAPNIFHPIIVNKQLGSRGIKFTKHFTKHKFTKHFTRAVEAVIVGKRIPRACLACWRNRGREGGLWSPCPVECALLAVVQYPPTHGF